ncbi:GNAT family N-acetyltransferase [Shewanella decolorationis]|uniref:GCN5-related N-acetyltransferase n=1 Tax=Shewanella decolorationis S12 TaxID=1353536 RepID=A0ABP2Z162_9GAMM|nr:GNAT family protein [Shewanella decolorationis]ESE40391.1 GCN5-related N-acetyltransferase [Shewanella decolorationis S12]GLR30717.1 GCN5 family N-acetyltransferase [Shewanella decolorationis]
MDNSELSNCLTGEHVVLEPLSLSHVAALSLAVMDGELWQLWFTSVPEPSAMKAYVLKALEEKARGESFPFAVRDRVSGEVVGCTRLCHWEKEHRHVEIGYTWYAKRAQRTGINTEAKLLLLTFAFESLDAIAVEFRTHWHNQASRQAIARLGAKQDGVLRNNKILKDGTIRDTVVYSIIDSEWMTVKQNLIFRLQQRPLV